MQVDVEHNELICTPGQIGCLFTLGVQTSRIREPMRVYVLGRFVDPTSEGWHKLGRGMSVAADGSWELDGQIGGYGRPIQPGETLEVIVVLFKESFNPLATYPNGFVLDDYQSLPGLTASSESCP